MWLPFLWRHISPTLILARSVDTSASMHFAQLNAEEQLDRPLHPIQTRVAEPPGDVVEPGQQVQDFLSLLRDHGLLPSPTTILNSVAICRSRSNLALSVSMLAVHRSRYAAAWA